MSKKNPILARVQPDSIRLEKNSDSSYHIELKAMRVVLKNCEMVGSPP
jgi:hypothetical protein